MTADDASNCSTIEMLRRRHKLTDLMNNIGDIKSRTIFRYSHGLYLFWYSPAKFFENRRDSSSSRYSPGFYHFVGTHTDSTFFRYSPGQFFDTRTDSTIFSTRHDSFSILALILPFPDSRTDSTFSSTRLDSFSILALILPFPDSRPDSTIFQYSHRFDPFPVLTRTVF